AENEVVLVVDKPTLISQLCSTSGQPNRADLVRGTYRIQWEPGCRLETKDFSINAALMPVGHRTVKSWHVPSGALNLVDYFSNKTYPSDLPPLIPLDVESLPVPPVIHWYHKLDITIIITWVVIAILVSLLVLFMWNSSYCGKLKSLSHSVAKEQETETGDINSSSVSSGVGSGHEDLPRVIFTTQEEPTTTTDAVRICF
ncbi:MAG: hypothetical protein GY702_22225, partial [Desulfobulbaceae bacterium]|nr:hypothetical protein [Desulfobulbaceae bacterium]